MDGRGKAKGAMACNGLDLTGQSFGRLFVIRRKKDNTKSGGRRWQCVCSCGKFCITQTNALTSGNKQSCGCLQKEAAKNTGSKNKLNGIHIDKDGYVVEICEGVKGYQHRRILEERLRRKLTNTEISHHKDNDPINNNPLNLMAVSRAAHINIHKNTGAFLLRTFIKHKFPSFNEIIAKSKAHWSAYSKLKRDNTDLCTIYFRKGLSAKRKVDVMLSFIEPFKSRRDFDNITASQKFILDGLTNAGVIKDDSPKYINSIKARVISAGKTYGVVVVVNEAPL